MNSVAGTLAVIFVFALAAAPRTLAQGQPPPRLPPTVRLELQPAAAPVPALKYALLPPFFERTPGNAAPLYYRMILMLNSSRNRQTDVRVVDLLGQSPGEMPRDEVRQILAEKADALQEARSAARREQCEWDYPIRGNTDLVALRMEEVQESRNIARLLALQARSQMLDGKYAEALDTLQTMFSLAGHLNQIPLIIPGLVATAEVSVTVDRLLEFAQLPGAPNLYWALAALPSPLIDARRSLESEGATAYISFPFLRDARSAERSPEEWQGLLEGMARTLARWGGFDPFFRIESEMTPEAMRMLVAGWALKGYPRAKQHLLDQGLSREQVEKMPVGQVIAIYTADLYDEVRDEVLKWQNVAWPAASLGMQQAELQIGRKPEILPLLRALSPAYRQWVFAARRNDRRIAELRVIEALRIYAARHDRKLPETLSDVTEVPIPEDPLTGKDFNYRREGATAILEVIPPPGFADSAYGRRYEITIAKP